MGHTKHIEYINLDTYKFGISEFYYNHIKNFLKPLIFQYPNFPEWFNRLFYKYDNYYFLNDNRKIILAQSDYQLVGVCILKKGTDENKICTLRVDSKFRRMGIASKFLEMSFDILEDNKPIITVSSRYKHMYDNLLKRYGFTLEEKKVHYYSLSSSEYVYNGSLNSYPNKLKEGNCDSKYFNIHLP